MGDFVFVWSPVADWPATYPGDLVRRFETGAPLIEDWRIRAVKAVRLGDRAFVFGQAKHHRCVFAVRTVHGAVKPAGTGRPHAMVPLLIERIVHPDDGGLLDAAELEALQPDALKGIRSSGMPISADLARAMDAAIRAKSG